MERQRQDGEAAGAPEQDLDGGATSVTGDAARDVAGHVGVGGEVGGSGSGDAPAPPGGAARSDRPDGDGAAGAASVTGDAARDLEGHVGVEGGIGGSGAGQAGSRRQGAPR